RIQSGDFPRPRSLVPCIPPALESICLKAMAIEARSRYASPQALADDVERWLADDTVAAHLEPPLVRARRWIRKHPRIDAALAARRWVGIPFAAPTSALMAGKNQQLAGANGELPASHGAERAARLEADARRQDAEQAHARLATANAELRAAIVAQGRIR